jgi:stearoyl-CoA desaturase (delta-9 desaturase)
MTYYCLRVMEQVGLVWDIKDVPVYVREGKSKQDAIAV